MSTYRFDGFSFINFDQHFITSSEEELSQIPNKISIWEQGIVPNQNKLSALQKNLEDINKVLIPIDQELSQVDSALAAAATGKVVDIVSHIAEAAATKGGSSSIANLVGDLGSGVTLLSLTAKRYKLSKAREPLAARAAFLEREMKPCEKDIEDARNAIFNLQQRTNDLTKLILDAKNFLQLLKENPLFLANFSAEHILQNLHAYEATHVSGVSRETQILCLELKNKIDFIKSQNDLNYRKRFAQLCGLLWDALDRMNKHPQGFDDAFAHAITSILGELHVAKDNDLPDDLAQGEGSVFDAYKNLQKLNPVAMKDLTDEDFLTEQEKTYLSACEDLKAALSVYQLNPIYTNLTKQATSVLEHVEAARKESLKKNDSKIDMHYYINVINSTKRLLDHPDDVQLHSNYLHLATLSKKGQPSKRKKIFGAMLGVLGAALVVGGIVATLGSFGVLGLPSLFGISIGVGLCAQAVSIVTTTLAVNALVGGVGLFAVGTRRGLPASMHRTVAASKHLVSEQNKVLVKLTSADKHTDLRIASTPL